MTQAITTAESNAEHVDTVDPSKNTDPLEFIIEHLNKLVKTAKAVYKHWKFWVPQAEQQQFQSDI